MKNCAKCYSMALNDDPDNILCDVCYQKNKVELLIDFVVQYLYSEHGICHPKDDAAPYTPEELKKQAQSLIKTIKER